jgi:DNA-binding MarR family transcriptional regulator
MTDPGAYCLLLPNLPQTVKIMDTMTKDNQLAQVRGLLNACDAFLALNGRIPLRCVQAFLAVALRPGQSVGDYARACRLSTSTMSRNLLDIGERNRTGEEGYGLVRGRENPNNRRECEYYLTERGTTFLTKVLTLLTPR